MRIAVRGGYGTILHRSGLLSLLYVAVLLIAQLCAAEEPTGDEWSRLFRKPNHPIVNEQMITERVLDSNPQPFLDWGIIQPGFVEYIDKEGEIIPLSGPHSIESPDMVRPVPVAIPRGIRIRIEPAKKGGTFAKEILTPTLPWENENVKAHTLRFDDLEGVYRLWYEAKGGLAYAESRDLRDWKRPMSKLVPFEGHEETNLIGIVGIEKALEGELKSAEEAKPGHAGSFFIDPTAPASERFKATFLAHAKDGNAESAVRAGNRPVSAMTGPGSTVMFGATSPDGIQWTVLPLPIMYHDADTQTVPFFDSLLGRYVMYTRQYELSRRSVARSETTDFTNWPLPVNIVTTGPEDLPTIDFYASGFANYPRQPDIRLLFCLTYNRGPDTSDIRLAVSRDGRVFHFPEGGPVVEKGKPGEPDGGFLSAAPSFVRTPEGRMIVLYQGNPLPHKFPRHRFQSSTQFVAWWPQDRLGGVEAEADGEFTTIPFRMKGKKLILNMLSERTGGVSVEVRDEEFETVPGKSFAEADNLTGDHLSISARWNGSEDLSPCQGKLVYLRFKLRMAKIYAISSEE